MNTSYALNNRNRLTISLILALILSFSPVSLCLADETNAPWWPSAWGAEDQAGASNLINPETVIRATQLIRTGNIIELGRVYEKDMPLKWDRVYTHRTGPIEGPIGDKKMFLRVEFLGTDIGHVGTQVDGLAHVSIETNDSPVERRYYNGFLDKEISSRTGVKKLGIENMKPIFTKGILIDVARAKGRMLNDAEEITLKDVKEALVNQNMSESDIGKGDVVLFNTGWGRLWMVDNERFNESAPGIGLEVARWLIGKNIVLVGSDTWNTALFPNLPLNDYMVHNELLTRNGIYIQENLQLEELSKNDVFEFAYIFNRVPFKGATGSVGSPIAAW